MGLPIAKGFDPHYSKRIEQIVLAPDFIEIERDTDIERLVQMWSKLFERLSNALNTVLDIKAFVEESVFKPDEKLLAVIYYILKQDDKAKLCLEILATRFEARKNMNYEALAGRLGLVRLIE